MVAATVRKNLRPPWQNRVMVSESFAFRKTKSYALFAQSTEFDFGDLLSVFVTKWRGTNRERSKIIYK